MGAKLTLAIPSWMDLQAPGAAAAARSIIRSDISRIQRQRLSRLTDERTKRAWLEPLRDRNKARKKLSEEELSEAHHELMWEAFRAPDFEPIKGAEVGREKSKLTHIGDVADGLAGQISEIARDAQVAGMWGAYQDQHPSAAAAVWPSNFRNVGTAIDEIAKFFRSAAPLYKPEGPVPPISHSQARDALKTTVIRKIGLTCLKHFGSPLYSTVATLANASLDRSDIDRTAVQGSLPRL